MYDVHFKLSCISWYIDPSTFPIENVKLRVTRNAGISSWSL